MWLRFLDSHLHLQDDCFSEKCEMVISKASSSGVCRLFCNATKEDDWQQVLEIAARHFWIIPFLGVHPWYADNVTTGWETRLHALLSRIKNGAGIGEIGLDKRQSADFNRQVFLFETQLEIAHSLNLPVSIHCVRCWGKLVDILESHAAKDRLPSTMIHSFTGSLEMMTRLVDIGCFLSYSAAITNPQQIGIQEVFRQTPLEHVLLETDAPHQINPALADQEDMITEYNEPTLITAIYRSASHLRNLHIGDLATQIWNNGTIYANTSLGR